MFLFLCTRLKIAKERERETAQEQISDFPETTVVSINESSNKVTTKKFQLILNFLKPN